MEQYCDEKEKEEEACSDEMEQDWEGGSSSSSDGEHVLDMNDLREAGIPTRGIVDYVWDGWYAALIVSKRKEAHHAITRDNHYRSISVDIIMGTSSQPDQNMEEANDVVEFHTAMYSPDIDGGERKRLMIAKAVVALSLKAMASVLLSPMEELCSRRGEDVKYKAVWESLLGSFAKFVLSIFSVEDLERIYHQNEISNEYVTFCSELDQSKCDPLVAVAERKVEVDKFSTLREHDVCDVIRQYQGRTENDDGEVCPWAFSLYPVLFDGVSNSDLSIALMELDKYVPLKEDCEMQLTLESTLRKSFLVMDTLVLEALLGIKIPELQFSTTSDDASKEVTYVFPDLLDCAILGLQELVIQKELALHYFQEAVSFPLQHSSFRPCTVEFVEVIKMADHERRMRRQHFISLQHILFVLSLSKVGGIVKRIFDNRNLPSNLSMLSIYKLSSDAAEYHGSKEVGLEHLVLAILLGKQENYPDRKEEHGSLVLDYEAWDEQLVEGLSNGDTKCGVERWADWDIFKDFIPDEERIGSHVMSGGNRLVGRLNQALNSGMNLPPIRMEKVN